MQLPENKKELERWISNLHSNVKSGDISTAAEILAPGLTKHKLIRILEKKIILAAPPETRKEIAKIILSAGRTLTSNEITLLKNYLEFSSTFTSSQKSALSKLRKILLTLPKISKTELLQISEESFEWYSNKIIKEVNLYSPDISVGEREHRLHEINGTLVDLAYAVTRAMNECSGIAMIETNKNLNDKKRYRALKIFRKTITLSSEINSLEWFFDSVSYGDFNVTEYYNSPLKVFHFQFTDPSRALAQTLSIRRTLVMKFTQRRSDRYIREKLLEAQPYILNRAFKHYLGDYNFSEEYNSPHLQTALNSTLVQIDAEDDLLTLASHSNPKVSIYYLAAFHLQCYAKVAKINSRRNHAPIPFEKLSEVADGRENRALFTLALENMTIDLPARNHMAIMKKPFIKEGTQSVRPFFLGDFGHWNLAVRESLIQGDTLGKELGKIWEKYYEHCFKNSNWKIIGKSIKLREKGQTLTDIDLLILKDSLLLVIEIKALAGSGSTVYEHWKNRQTIKIGCSQARLAAEYLIDNNEKLVSLCGKRISNKITKIQPVVLTNAEHFGGWSYSGVPVIGEVTRKAICDGERVEYFTPQSSTPTHTHHFTKPEDLTPQEILRILTSSVELKISALTDEIKYTPQKVGKLIFLTPEFITQKVPHAFEPQA